MRVTLHRRGKALFAILGLAALALAACQGGGSLPSGQNLGATSKSASSPTGRINHNATREGLI